MDNVGTKVQGTHGLLMHLDSFDTVAHGVVANAETLQAAIRFK
jgi:hypothetical protein